MTTAMNKANTKAKRAPAVRMKNTALTMTVIMIPIMMLNLFLH